MSSESESTLGFDPYSQDAWQQVQAAARAIPPMPHFWAAGRHAGIVRRAELKYGYSLLAQSVGGFGSYLTVALPYFITLGFMLAGAVSGLAFDYERPGGLWGPDDLLVAQQPWTLRHTAMLIVFSAVAGYLLGFYVWQPLRWYNSAWGDCIALDEIGGECVAMTRTKVHRLVFAARQHEGYYRGNAREGHISRARILLRNEPTYRAEDGRIAGGNHPVGLAQCLIEDLYQMDSGQGNSTDDPGRAYETLRLRTKAQAERARNIASRGYNRFWKLENGLIVLATVFVIAGLLLMLSITGGGDPIVDPSAFGVAP